MRTSPLESWAAFLTIVSILLGGIWRAIRWGNKILAELKANTVATRLVAKKLDQHIDEHVKASLKGGRRHGRGRP